MSYFAFDKKLSEVLFSHFLPECESDSVGERLRDFPKELTEKEVVQITAWTSFPKSPSFPWFTLEFRESAHLQLSCAYKNVF